MRPRVVKYSEHLQATSISELEMWLHYRGLTSPGDIDLLVREGLLMETFDGHVLTDKGEQERAIVERARLEAKGKDR